MPRQFLFLALDFAGLLMELATYILMLGLALLAVAVVLPPYGVATAVFWAAGAAMRWWTAPAEALREPEGRRPRDPEWTTIEDPDAKLMAVVRAWLDGDEIEVHHPGNKPSYPCGSRHCNHESRSGALVCRRAREQFQHQEVTR